MKLVFEADRVRLYEGDARALTALPDGSVHLIVTSPPYFNARAYSTWSTYPDYLADMGRVWAECWRVLVEGGRIAVNTPDGYGRPGNGGYRLIGDDTARGLEAAGFELRGRIVWDKSPAGLGTAWGSWKSARNPSLRDCHEVIVVGHKGSPRRAGGLDTVDRDTFLAATGSIWRVKPARVTFHPAPWPVELPRRLIHLLSFAGDVVLDPFCGSATTVFEAARAGRVGVGVDIHGDYLAQAVATLDVEALAHDHLTARAELTADQVEERA